MQRSFLSGHSSFTHVRTYIVVVSGVLFVLACGVCVYFLYGTKSDSALRVIDPEHRFSIEIPNTLTFKRIQESDASEMFLFYPSTSKPASDLTTSTLGFKMVIMPYIEEIITKERLIRDMPNGDIRDLKEVLIGKNRSIRALIFRSHAQEVGDLREVWFVDGHFIYEVTALLRDDVWLAGIMSTLQLENTSL